MAQKAEVAYLQSQDGNLYSSTPDIPSQFKALLPDVPRHLEFCTDALGTMVIGIGSSWSQHSSQVHFRTP